ncbi:MAG TPA: hypothetical protein VLD55_12425, partial [Candidatus Sulfobium mesophilum]|nr:hypothetical protein [Candidatus Sulfobium mesophilum]
MNHASHQMNSSSEKGNKGSGLDFGETMDMSSMPSMVDLSSFKKLQPEQWRGCLRSHILFRKKESIRSHSPLSAFRENLF